MLGPGQIASGYDRTFVPQVGYTTGGLDIHGVSGEDSGRVDFRADEIRRVLRIGNEQPLD